MPVDFRWLVFTVVSVFLSLAIGILLGSIVPQDRALVERQEVLIRGLERDFERLRSENRHLRSEIAALQEQAEAWEQAVTGIAAAVSRPRLDGRHVLWVESARGEDERAREAVLPFIREAGGIVYRMSLSDLARQQPDRHEDPPALVFLSGAIDRNRDNHDRLISLLTKAGEEGAQTIKLQAAATEPAAADYDWGSVLPNLDVTMISAVHEPQGWSALVRALLDQDREDDF